MTVKQFRQHPTLCSDWAKELRENSILRIVLGVMTENHPARYPVKSDLQDDVSPTQAAIQLGETRGYSKYDSTLYYLAERELRQIDVGETTYDQPPVEV